MIVSSDIKAISSTTNTRRKCQCFQNGSVKGVRLEEHAFLTLLFVCDAYLDISFFWLVSFNFFSILKLYLRQNLHRQALNLLLPEFNTVYFLTLMPLAFVDPSGFSGTTKQGCYWSLLTYI